MSLQRTPIAGALAGSRWLLIPWALAGGVPASPAQTVQGEPVVVTASRFAEAASQVPFSVSVLDSDSLQTAPVLTVDDALRSVPDFTLFRRNDSLTANPTTQGVSLRGLGPSGASRSLVLLDGVPLNDPFGGWITWSQVPRLSLEKAEIVPGGGSTAWGDAALSGVIQLITEPPSAESERFEAALGAFETRSAEVELSAPVGRGAIQVLGDEFATDGFPLIAPENRGPIDVPAASRHRWAAVRWSEPVADGVEATVAVRGFEEFRNNGTPYEQNDSREHFVSAALTGHNPSGFDWTAQAYAQDENFASTYSSINAARTAETPASNQYAVPSSAEGAAWTGSWTSAGGSRTSLGVDFRDVRGETREDFSYDGDGYADFRLAGGRQDFAGAFVERAQTLASGLRATAGLRVDGWEETEGHWIEGVMATGHLTRDDVYPSRDGVNPSPSAGLTWQAAPDLRFHAAVEEGYRVPTLNELYRPFRQGNNITEANPNLSPERVTSPEAGVEWTRGAFTLGATGFWDDLRDAVGNVTIARGPGTFPGFGFIPAGGTGLERLNLDDVWDWGGDFSLRWRPGGPFEIEASYLWDQTDVRRAPVAPQLVGLRLAEVPENTGVLSVDWRSPGGGRLVTRLRWIGRQYDDDANQLPLAAAVVADATFSQPIAKGFSLFLTLENVGNARVETAHSSLGVFNVGTPRLLEAGVRWTESRR